MLHVAGPGAGRASGTMDRWLSEMLKRRLDEWFVPSVDGMPHSIERTALRMLQENLHQQLLVIQLESIEQADLNDLRQRSTYLDRQRSSAHDTSASATPVEST